MIIKACTALFLITLTHMAWTGISPIAGMITAIGIGAWIVGRQFVEGPSGE